MNIKPIKQLPELGDHHEWACEGGCDRIEPKLHRNIYAESLDLEGNKTREEAEHYYTCQEGHLLAVWDESTDDYLSLPDKAYRVRENRFNTNLEGVNKLLAELDETEAVYSSEDMKDSPFKFAKAGFIITLKTGEEVSIDRNYLNEIKVQLLESEGKSYE